MRARAILSAAVLGLALACIASVSAVPPTIGGVGAQSRHPIVTFSAPKADDVVIEIATKPDRASDGEFLSENERVFDLVTDSELQAGRWLYADQLDPGKYYVMVKASPAFDLCYQSGGTYDPSCADGYSDPVALTIPAPPIKYTAAVAREKYSNTVELTLTAKPLGQKLRYRVCYRTSANRDRCLNGTLDGYSWNSPADDRLTVNAKGLSAFTTFKWSVGGKVVASKRSRVR